MQILHILQLSGPSTPKVIAAATGLTSGGVTVALDRLERGGYIHRQPNPQDRRSLLIHLNLARLAKAAELYQDVEGKTRRLLATLPERDLRATLRFFDAMAQVRHPGFSEDKRKDGTGTAKKGPRA
jgi:DNA-binding MarR family transcriptional regulator